MQHGQDQPEESTDSSPTHDGASSASTHKPANATNEAIERPVGGAFAFNDTELPHRFKRTTFDLYEPYIARAIRTGEPVEINPAPLRATTFAARARDALVAKKRFNWPASFTLFELEQAGLTVRHGDHTVVIGPKVSVGKGRVIGEALAFTSIDHKRLGGIFVDQVLKSTELIAFATLLSAKLIAGPVILRRTHSEVELNYIEEHYDVAVLPKNEKGETIIL